jgi:hypothetical protein
VVFALSNPTSRAECSAEQAYRWTDGRAVFSSGSPCAPLEVDGRRFAPSQTNNAYIFPGLGLAVTATGARRVTEEMFLAAARALAEQADESLLDLSGWRRDQLAYTGRLVIVGVGRQELAEEGILPRPQEVAEERRGPARGAGGGEHALDDPGRRQGGQEPEKFGDGRPGTLLEQRCDAPDESTLTDEETEVGPQRRAQRGAGLVDPAAVHLESALSRPILGDEESREHVVDRGGVDANPQGLGLAGQVDDLHAGGSKGKKGNVANCLHHC